MAEVTSERMTKEEHMSIIKQQLVEIFDSALRAVDPCNAVKKAIRILDP